MILEIGDWVLDADIQLTMELSVSQAKEHCDCGYCRNFYASVDAAYPSMRTFLSQFGLDIEGPDELSPFEPTIYEATYIVQGNILRAGSTPLFIDGVPLLVKSAKEADLDTVHPEPYFALCVGLMELPWTLTEDRDEVVSPANEDAYLQRMQRKLLERLQNDTFYS